MATRFEITLCSQCGGEFGPGDSGYSHCDQHREPMTYVDVISALCAMPNVTQEMINAIERKVAELERQRNAERSIAEVFRLMACPPS